jgi:CRISPR/Cas system CSM-associated protein Csm2 small subunit
MSDLTDTAMHTLRKHIADRRTEIAAKFPKNLGPIEYNLLCGRHQELEAMATVLQEAIRKANSAAQPIDDDNEGNS